MPEKQLFIAIICLSVFPSWAAALDDSARQVIQPLLGDYEGQWTTEASRGDFDDISRYDLTESVLRIMTQDGQIHLSFYLDQDAAARSQPLDLLGFGCKSQVGEMLNYTLTEPSLKEVNTVLRAEFAFDWGKCPSRVWAFPSNRLHLQLAVNSIDGENVVYLSLLRRLVPQNQTYIERDGERHRVVIRPVAGGTLYNPKQQFCVVNEVGETEECFERHEEIKHFVVPFPIVGASALWWTHRDKVSIVKGQRALYHEAVYRQAIEPHQTTEQ
jgi:hypothetical protein